MSNTYATLHCSRQNSCKLWDRFNFKPWGVIETWIPLMVEKYISHHVSYRAVVALIVSFYPNPNARAKATTVSSISAGELKTVMKGWTAKAPSSYLLRRLEHSNHSVSPNKTEESLSRLPSAFFQTFSLVKLFSLIYLNLVPRLWRNVLSRYQNLLFSIKPNLIFTFRN